MNSGNINKIIYILSFAVICNYEFVLYDQLFNYSNNETMNFKYNYTFCLFTDILSSIHCLL